MRLLTTGVAELKLDRESLPHRAAERPVFTSTHALLAADAEGRIGPQSDLEPFARGDRQQGCAADQTPIDDQFNVAGENRVASLVRHHHLRHLRPGRLRHADKLVLRSAAPLERFNVNNR
jgi:hypothetical protein